MESFVFTASSCLRSIQRAGQDLIVEFTSGNRYFYPGLGDRFDAIVNAKSAGRAYYDLVNSRSTGVHGIPIKSH